MENLEGSKIAESFNMSQDVYKHLYKHGALKSIYFLQY